ncbi:WD domain protein [Taphrina deformans PYCC 5710]|uniref:WD domain protein n=1 Tax=Taphrina deformans (strain PYCC 5710 / ATCC 11124 / CBS 356.35 / IMI 108563 / JCM 9778 / NBRC 8474) TaxID=1097556 RepID=R4XCI8_TAPDE|nr:WD domain protein [Taphrina deformans PYCC 5710]|eukprot:CCG83321.1 WD domain protein [Taphrina deformans PYCC 5710]
MKAETHSNGHVAHGNGSHTKAERPTSIQDEETVRLIIQALGDMGYTDAVRTLSRESGVSVESALVEDFRNSILTGGWAAAERALKDLELNHAAQQSEVLFLIREQKFLELLESQQASAALITLRTELSPLGHNTERLHFLSSLIMASSPQDLCSRSNWTGREGDSRHALLRKVSTYISPNSMIPEARLATLLNAARNAQIEDCLYHTTNNRVSFLIPNHACPRSSFPLHNSHVLRSHTDEVWHVQYSGSGRYLASTGADGLIVVYDVRNMRPIHHLNLRTSEDIKRDKKDGKLKGITYIAFNSDETLLMTCSQDNVIVHWDIVTGAIMNQITNAHLESVSSACWLPGTNSGFVSGGLDKRIILYDDKGGIIHVWETERIYDVKVSNDGKYVIAISTESGLYIFDLETKDRLALLHTDFELTSLNISKDSRRMIISCSPKVPKGRSGSPKAQTMEVQEWSIPDLNLLRKVTGQKQGEFVIRSCYAGELEQFILSGSEDSDVYLWHRKSGTLLEQIKGHSKIVGAVAWNPTAPQWASASDDRTVRIWEVGTDVDAEAEQRLALPTVQPDDGAHSSATEISTSERRQSSRNIHEFW